MSSTKIKKRRAIKIKVLLQNLIHPNCGSVGLTAVDYVTILVMRGRNTKIDH